jgi:hypothetical protein
MRVPACQLQIVPDALWLAAARRDARQPRQSDRVARGGTRTVGRNCREGHRGCGESRHRPIANMVILFAPHAVWQVRIRRWRRAARMPGGS